MASVLPITAIVLLLSITVAPLDSAVLVLFLFGCSAAGGRDGPVHHGSGHVHDPHGGGGGRDHEPQQVLSAARGGLFSPGRAVHRGRAGSPGAGRAGAAIDNLVLILTVAVGVGFFLVVAALRIRLAIPLRRLLLVFYCIVFLLAALAPGTLSPCPSTPEA